MITFFDEQDKIELTEAVTEAVSKAVEAAQKEAGVACCVNIQFTDNEGIRSLNRDFRGIDRETDVLSFPAYELPTLFAACRDMLELEYMEDYVFMGDIAISMERAVQQAKEYGHSLRRETAFLALHGMLHLLGYDHMIAQEEQVMTERQKEILDSVDIGRELDGE